MQRMVDCRQTRLFDPYKPVRTAANRQWLEDNWPGVFRHAILERMPVATLQQHFDPHLGRPTQELYSMAGLILLRECMNWTKEQAGAYRFHMGGPVRPEPGAPRPRSVGPDPGTLSALP